MRRYRDLMLLLVLAGLFALSTPAWEGSGRDISHWDNFLRFLGRFFPPDFSDHEELLQGLIETAQVGFLATAFASVISLFLALVGGPWVPKPARAAVLLVLASIRSIPSLVWAVIAVAVVGPNPRAGVLALALYSIGYLGKFLTDDFASLDLSLMRTYQRWGLHPLFAFFFGFWPQLRKLYGAHCLWMLEYNIRSAAIIGYVGAGGLGLRLHAYQEYGQWNRFGAVLLIILGIVLCFELLVRMRHRKVGAA
jgi:phosphonate transport system permease protein